jgi:tetratricopeptide (TPR) repeat protein
MKEGIGRLLRLAWVLPLTGLLIACLVIIGLSLTPRYRSDRAMRQAYWRYNRGQLAEAIPLFSTAVAINPENAAAYNMRGHAHADMGDFELALDDYDQVVAQYPDYAWVYKDRGDAHLALGEFSAALADYDQVIRLQPHFTMAYLSRAQVYEALDQPDAALVDYEHFLDIYGAEDGYTAYARSRAAALEDGQP